MTGELIRKMRLAPSPDGEMTGAAAETTLLADRAAAWRERLSHAQLLGSRQTLDLDQAIADARAGRLENPPPPLLTVLLLGATGGGKSALLNALAGAEIARSHHLRPTTSEPTIYLHESVSPARLYEYGPALGELVSSGGAVLKVHQREDLRNKVIIDAPDIDSYRTAHRDTVLSLLPVTDVALYVVTPFSYKDDLGWTLVQRERGRRAFAFVMNKWDAEGAPRATPGETRANDDFAHLLAASGGYAEARIFLTSAQYWAADPQQRAQLPQPADGENFPELRTWLEQGLSTSLVEQIQRRRRRALWAALAAAIAEALPPDFDAEDAMQTISTELQTLESEGRTLWQPVVLRRAEALSRRREEEARPHSPGPFGWLSVLFGSVAHAGKTWRRVAEPEPDISADDLRLTAERSVEIVHRKLDRIEWILRQKDIPTGDFAQINSNLAGLAENALLLNFEQTSNTVFLQLTRPWRTMVGWTVLTIFELLTVGLLGLAAWRLVQAFVAGQYLNLTFALNLLALLIILLLAGSAIMAVLFPPVKSRVRKALSSAITEQWSETSSQAGTAAQQYLAALQQLRKDGAELLQECHNNVRQITREMDAVSDVETQRLFVE